MTATDPGDRRLDIDHLRGAVVLSLIPFHAARLFDREPWHVKDAASYAAADLLVALLNVPSMPLLFLLAGASAHYALRRRKLGQFLRERLARLFLPLVFGMLAIVPPQVYVERVSPAMAGRQSPVDFAGSYLDFLPQALVCCYPEANLSWHHLWFLAYLLFYAVLLAPVFFWWGTQGGRRSIARLGDVLAPGRRILWIAIAIVAIEIALRRAFPSTHDLVADWANHAHYAFVMLAGYCIAADPRLDEAIRRNRVIALIGALALLALWFAMPRGLPALALRMAAEWLSLVALLGFARVHLSRRLPFLTGFARHAFPFYIVHQTIIVLLGWGLVPWDDRPFVKFLSVAALAFCLSLALARLVDLSAPTRLLFGLSAPTRR